MTWVLNFCQQIWLVLCELAPWFLLGAIIAGLLHGLAPAGFVRRRFSGLSGVLLAVILGIPLPLCSCAVIPTGIGLRRNGASEGASVSFLIATPQTGIDSVFVTAAFLGWTFAFYKLVVALVLGVAAGWIIEWIGDGRSPITEDHSESKKTGNNCCHSTTEPTEQEINDLPSVSVSLGTFRPPASSSASGSSSESSSESVRLAIAGPEQRPAYWYRYLRSSLASSLSIVRSIYIWVLVGVVISAALSTLLPAELISRFGGQSYGLQLLVALFLGIPLYVCATASVPIAAALVGRGLSVGATSVFLIAGPATNIATIGAVKSQFSRLAFWTYLATAILGSVLFAVLFDILFPNTIAIRDAHRHEHKHWFNQVCAGLLLAIFAYLWLPTLQSIAGQKASNSSPGGSCCN